jgi:hippurate hydrolase
MDYTTLLEESRRMFPEIVELRRALHRIPEVGLNLPKTRQMVLEALEGLPLELHLHETTSGMAAVLEGGKPGPTIILRGDMDGLAMPEDTGLDFASEHEGSMHACGHDLHTSMLIGAVRLLSARRDELAGKALFMFQPGEEGHFGARFMLEEGLLDTVDPKPTTAFAIHVSSIYESGTVHLKPGPYMAAADKLRVTVRGKGGHASSPWNAVDPVPVAAEIITATQVALTRTVDVFDPAVLTFAQMSAGSAYNVIPATATLTGTTRTVSEERRDQVHAMIEQVCSGVGAAHGVEVEVHVERGYPVTINDDGVAATVDGLARSLVGDERVVQSPTPVMGAEDWSYVLQQVPGVMAFLGACPIDLKPEDSPANHSNLVRFDEDAMATGVALHTAVAMHYLS